MRTGFYVSAALFFAACCIPALEFRSDRNVPDIMFGLRALAVGWSGVFAAVFSWYANPFWFLGMVLGLFRKPLPAGICGVVAIAIALTLLSDLGRVLPADEGGVTHTSIYRMLPGFYVWMASLVMIPVAAILQKFVPAI
ncbi:MAG: hypothetical protein ABI823_11105 [Bryobacteraceae bacterium]